MTTDLPDVNLLVALHLKKHQHHIAAHNWVNQADLVAITPITQIGLLRTLLNPVLVTGLSPQATIAMVTAFSSIPEVVFWPDDDKHLLVNPFSYALTGYKQVPDLHLLALAAANGGRLVTFDKKLQAALRPIDKRHVFVL